VFNWLIRTAAAGIAVCMVLMIAPAAYGQPQSPLEPLVDAAARRLQVAEPVVASKFHTGGPIEDPAREGQVLAYVSAEATKVGVESAYVTTVFRDQIDATVAIQYSRLSEWKLDPASAPIDAPDLASTRGIIDALNREMVTEMADEWDVLHSPSCVADLDAAKAAVVRARSLDPLYQQAIDFATRSYCP